MVPADHNLTITEANMIYGEQAHQIIKGRDNFNIENIGWFYQIFTPFQDFWFPFAKQTFTFLSWGDSEDILFDEQGFGHLPRTENGVTKRQLKLLQKASDIDAKADFDHLLFSHFTLVCYSPDIPIYKKGHIYLENERHTDFDWGTFESNREAVYELVKNKFKYCFSGHSHRAGLYRLAKTGSKKRLNTWGMTPESLVEGYPDCGFKTDFFYPGDLSETDRNTHLKEKKIDPDEMNLYEQNAAFSKDEVRLLVTTSGGPIAQQNYYQEFNNWGMVPPTGYGVTFDDTGRDWIKTFTAKTKPRIALPFEYADVVGDKVFRKIECEQNEEDGNNNYVFQIRLSKKLKLPDNNIFKKARLFIFNPDIEEPQFKKINIDIQNSPKKQQIIINFFNFRKLVKVKSMMYLELEPDAVLFSKRGYQFSDHHSWIFPVKMKPRMIEIGEKNQKKQKGWELKRDWDLDMQKPDFRFYERNYQGNGYA